jgi:RNA methyltransferase, TrmH family
MEPGPRDLRQRYRDARHDPALVVLEGFHALKHALRFGATIVDVRSRDPYALGRLATELAPDVGPLLATLARPAPTSVFDQLAPSPHPTGVIGLAERPAVDVAAVLADPAPAPLVLLERPTHHGNMGAVVRVAAAAGAAGVLTTGPHDPWHPASVRGGAGLQFALPVAALEALPETDRPIVVLDPAGESIRGAASGAGTAGGELWGQGGALPPRAILAFGSERAGVSQELGARAAVTISIPMRSGVSSLNLATAVAVTLFCGVGTP